MQHCFVCDKKPIVGRSIARRGLAKKTGGIGKKTTGITRRRFLPNLQKVKAILLNGTVRSIWACASCLQAGKVRKAVGHRKAALQKLAAAKTAA
ncbi:MAG TPA: 50S ribosomal protein L28 [Verrucomicrobiae bacterium]|jgi:large subunit ribosomal protein L28|nr:50S ribosomal protein L28 [Verrucomicrobiae bacterium]